MEFKCEFCGSKFNRVCNLITHKKTAKYCLETRGLKSLNECMGCNKVFGKKCNMERHQLSCVLYIKEENERLKRCLEEKDTKIVGLQEEIAKLRLVIAESKGKISVYKERPSIVNNTQYINPKLLTIQCDKISPLTLENVKKEVEGGGYTYDNFIRGEAGLVDFISTLISDEDQKNYVCTDSARNKFHRLIETREWENDNGATFLNKILDQLRDNTSNYYSKVIKMTETPTDRDLGEFLMAKTKPMVMGIAHPKSRDRNALFNRIRTEVRKLASI